MQDTAFNLLRSTNPNSHHYQQDTDITFMVEGWVADQIDG